MHKFVRVLDKYGNPRLGSWDSVRDSWDLGRAVGIPGGTAGILSREVRLLKHFQRLITFRPCLLLLAYIGFFMLTFWFCFKYVSVFPYPYRVSSFILFFVVSFSLLLLYYFFIARVCFPRVVLSLLLVSLLSSFPCIAGLLLFPCISIVDLGFYRVFLEFLQYLALWCLVHLVLGFLAFLRKSLCVLACQASEFLVSQAEEFSRVERISLLVCQA